jgi:hypothetical protein
MKDDAVLGGGEHVAEATLHHAVTECHAAAGLVRKGADIGDRGGDVVEREPHQGELTLVDGIAAIEGFLDVAPHLVAERPAGAELGLGGRELLVEALAAAARGERRGTAGWRVGERAELVEHAAAEAERHAGVTEGRHADDADLEQVAALLRHDGVGRVRELLGLVDAGQRVVDARRRHEPQHVPVAEELRMLDRDDEGARLGNPGPRQEAQRAVLIDHGAGMQILGMQHPAAVAPAPRQAVALPFDIGAASRPALAGDDRDVRPIAAPEHRLCAGGGKIPRGRAGADVAGHQHPAGRAVRLADDLVDLERFDRADLGAAEALGHHQAEIVAAAQRRDGLIRELGGGLVRRRLGGEGRRELPRLGDERRVVAPDPRATRHLGGLTVAGSSAPRRLRANGCARRG